MSFIVAAIVNEPRSVIERFVTWYLSQGAEGIVLYFDNPDDPLIAELQVHSQITIIPCTDNFWRSIDTKPSARFTKRQNAALNHAYRNLAAEWLLNVDADELVYFADYTIAERLAKIPSEITSILVVPTEHVLSDRDGTWFRVPMPRQDLNQIYGEDADLFRLRRGLVGHADGKSFHRRGQTGIRLRQHWAENAAGEVTPALRLDASDQAYLLHFVAPDYDIWRAKMDWRLSSHGFSGPMKERIFALRGEIGDESFYPDLYRCMHHLSAERHDALLSSGYLLQIDLDLGA